MNIKWNEFIDFNYAYNQGFIFMVVNLSVYLITFFILVTALSKATMDNLRVFKAIFVWIHGRLARSLWLCHQSGLW